MDTYYPRRITEKLASLENKEKKASRKLSIVVSFNATTEGESLIMSIKKVLIFGGIAALGWYIWNRYKG